MNAPAWAIAVCLAATPAAAAESYPSSLRTITATDAISPCIGDPKTPVCAVETALACYLRNTLDLCRAVGVVPPANPSKSGRETYRVMSQRLYRLKQGTPEERAKLFAEVAIDSYNPEPERFLFVTQKHQTDWHVIKEGAEGIIGSLNDDVVEYLD